MKKETLLSECNLSVRLLNTLASAEIITVENLMQINVLHLIKYRNLGKKSAKVIKEFLETINPTDNNGWIKIKSEKDLPTENGFYWTINKKGLIFQNHIEDIEPFHHTHYQPIVKPLKPIY